MRDFQVMHQLGPEDFCAKCASSSGVTGHTMVEDSSVTDVSGDPKTDNFSSCGPTISSNFTIAPC